MQILFLFVFFFGLNGCKSTKELDSLVKYVKDKAIDLIVKYGFDAGSGYPEVWIRDTNTFLELALDHLSPTHIKNNLTVFFGFQEVDGNVIDGFLPKEKAVPPFRTSKYYPQYAGFKNTVEIDQETSLVQAIHLYVSHTGDRSILDTKIGPLSITDRLSLCLSYLLNKKYNKHYGLLYSATRADWGDVQPETSPGIIISNKTHWAISLYDNAMFVLALEAYLSLFPSQHATWYPIKQNVTQNIMKYLWSSPEEKFIPHIYLERGSPFPSSFDENKIYYHGSTAIAIQANILNREQALGAFHQMLSEVAKVGGKATIGLTMYPAYPTGMFKNEGMHAYHYQNGGDWTWFGGRMVKELARLGYTKEAWEGLEPVLQRVYVFQDFYEWYYPMENSPQGSAKFKGSAGVLYSAILELERCEGEK